MGWVPWEADLSGGVAMKRSIRKCSWNQYLWKESEENRTGWREVLGCDTVSTETSVTLQWALELGRPFRDVPHFEWVGWAFIPLCESVIGCSLPRDATFHSPTDPSKGPNSWGHGNIPSSWRELWRADHNVRPLSTAQEYVIWMICKGTFFPLIYGLCWL